MMDGFAYRVEQRCAAACEIVLLRHGRHLLQRQPVVNDGAVAVKQDRGDKRLARFLLLLGDHGVEPPNGVRFQPRHRAAAIENKNQFCHGKTLLRLITLLS